jgi:dipeptidyl aminopeptidase/acylaminoacyl peptidase
MTARGVTLRRIAPIWLLALAVLLWVVGVSGAHEAAAQASDSATLTVVAEAINVRSGPGVGYSVVSGLVRGDVVPIVGQDAGSGWWLVQLPDGQSGWVTSGSAYVRISGDTTAFAAGEATGGEATPAASPEARTGGVIVFQTVSGGQIYIVNADGSNLRYLTVGMDPAISPDGRRVAFTRWDDTQHGALGSLWVINVDGSDERAILGDIHQPKSPVWSADGTRIVISMQHGGRTEVEYKCTGERPPDGAYDIRMKREAEPDGDIEMKFCYYLPPHPRWALRDVDVETGSFEDLPGDLFSYAPDWSPTEAWHLVYNGERGLVNLDLNQGTTWALTTDVNDHAPVFSPDGARIAVSYWQNDHWEIHVMNADGNGRVRLTKLSAREEIEQMLSGQFPKAYNNAAPAWSPDGSQIAFLTDRSGRWEVWVMNADGSDQHALLPGDVQAQMEIEYYGMDERALSWR